MTLIRRQRALDQLLDRLLADSDPQGMNAAADELGILNDGAISIGYEDEKELLLDYYLFAAGDTPRIQTMAAEFEGSADDRVLLDALVASSLAVYKSRSVTETEVVARDVVRGNDLTFAIPAATPFVRGEQCAAFRAVEVAEGLLTTQMPVMLPMRLEKFFGRPAAVYEASLILGGKSEELDSVESADDLTDRTFARAILGIRAADHMASEDKTPIFLTKKKRSLAKPSRRRRKK